MKKGFTLIELLVSLVIISVTMVFISTFVLNLKDEKGKVIVDIPQKVDQAAISKELNEEAIKYGISNIDCESPLKCTIIYSDGKERLIEISGSTIKYTEESNIIFVRTLNSGTFTSIQNDTSLVGGKTLYKYIINVSTGNNVEVYYYDN